HGWGSSSLLGAAFATCALIVWATDARRRAAVPRDGAGTTDAHRGEERRRDDTEQVGPVPDRSEVF
ncbi:MFS transporter, partial [Streptomyces longwoodensis]